MLKEYNYEEINNGRSGESLISALDKIRELNRKLDLIMECLEDLDHIPEIERLLTCLKEMD